MSSDRYQEYDEIQTREVLWVCKSCDVWWISQPIARNAWRLLPMVKLSDLSFYKNRPPAWQVCGPDPSICPECNKQLVRQRLATEEIPTPYIAIYN